MKRVVLIYRCGHHTVVTAPLKAYGYLSLQASRTKCRSCQAVARREEQVPDFLRI